MRAAPVSILRASLRVDSPVRTTPMTGELHVAAVADEPEAAGGEPARQPGPAAGFEPGHPRAARLAVAECGGEVRAAGGVCLLGVLRPPRRDLVLGGVPRLAQAVRGRVDPRRALVGGDAVGLLP